MYWEIRVLKQASAVLAANINVVELVFEVTIQLNELALTSAVRTCFSLLIPVLDASATTNTVAVCALFRVGDKSLANHAYKLLADRSYVKALVR